MSVFANLGFIELLVFFGGISYPIPVTRSL